MLQRHDWDPSSCLFNSEQVWKTCLCSYCLMCAWWTSSLGALTWGAHWWCAALSEASALHTRMWSSGSTLLVDWLSSSWNMSCIHTRKYKLSFPNQNQLQKSHHLDLVSVLTLSVGPSRGPLPSLPCEKTHCEEGIVCLPPSTSSL